MEGQKFSKSLGNSIDPVELVDAVGSDAVRYYLLRNLSFASDGDFSRAGLLRHYNDELGNDLGNLLNRVVSMIKRYRKGQVPQPDTYNLGDEELRLLAAETHARASVALEAWEIGQAFSLTWNLVRRANQYIEQNAPWQLARQPELARRLDTVLYVAAETTRILAVLLAPYIPVASQRILAQLGLEPASHGAWEKSAHWGGIALERVEPGPVLFPRLDSSSLSGM
jgi:methionyl-tRNA synthetase